MSQREIGIDDLVRFKDAPEIERVHVVMNKKECDRNCAGLRIVDYPCGHSRLHLYPLDSSLDVPFGWRCCGNYKLIDNDEYKKIKW